jgi:glycosyltransferase involved in cell wall biosynthesis
VNTNGSPRVLVVTGAYAPELSGGGLQARALIGALREHARFMVLTTSTDDALPKESEVDGVEVLRVAVDIRSRLSKVRAAFRMATLLMRHRSDFDLVHLHGFSRKAMLVVPIAHALGKKVVLTLHTAEEDEPDAVRALGRFAFACFKSIDLYVAISPRVADAYRAAGFPPARLAMGSNGIDLHRFQPAMPADRDALRTKLGLDDRRRWILFVGFFSRDKGPHVLFQAWRRLAAALRARSGLLFVGATESQYHEIDSTLAEEIRSGAAEAGASESVIFYGETAAVEECFRAADVFVFPSRREARGMALVEAMACGLPSIASRLPGATDHVEDGVSGLLVPPHDVDALAAALTCLLTDPQRAAALGRRAREAVEASFDIRRTSLPMVELYRSLIRGSTPAPGFAR